MGWVRFTEKLKEIWQIQEKIGICSRYPLVCDFLFLFSLCKRAECGPVKHDPELQGDEEEGEDSLLRDSEEMDLLGEIFETLSSRSSHERGLLYGTRSLDLFGQDSHDYITKVRTGDTANT